MDRKMKLKINLKPFSFIVLVSFTFNIFAQSNDFKISDKKIIYTQKGSEYISGSSYRDKMMKVKMIGEVNKPGVHVLPANSSFTTLLSYAGGPTKDADTSKIHIKRETEKGYKNIKLDFDDFIKSDQMDISLKHNDLIYVKKESAFISSKTTTVIATFLSIIVSGFIINDRL